MTDTVPEDERKRSWKRLALGVAIWLVSPLVFKPLAVVVGEIMEAIGFGAARDRAYYMEGYLSGALLVWLVFWFERPQPSTSIRGEAE